MGMFMESGIEGFPGGRIGTKYRELGFSVSR